MRFGAGVIWAAPSTFSVLILYFLALRLARQVHSSCSAESSLLPFHCNDHQHSAPSERAMSVKRRCSNRVIEVQAALLRAVGKLGAHVVVDLLRLQRHQRRDELTRNQIFNGLQVSFGTRHCAAQVLLLSLQRHCEAGVGTL